MTTRLEIDLGDERTDEDAIRRVLRDALDNYVEERTPVDVYVRKWTGESDAADRAGAGARIRELSAKVRLAQRLSRAVQGATVQRLEELPEP